MWIVCKWVHSWQCLNSKISSYNRLSELWSTCYLEHWWGFFCLFFNWGNSPFCGDKADPRRVAELQETVAVHRSGSLFGYLSICPDSNPSAFSNLIFSSSAAVLSELKSLSSACSESNLLRKYVHWIKPPDGSDLLVSPLPCSSTHRPRRVTSSIVFWKRYCPAEIAFTEDTLYF